MVGVATRDVDILRRLSGHDAAEDSIAQEIDAILGINCELWVRYGGSYFSYFADDTRGRNNVKRSIEICKVHLIMAVHHPAIDLRQLGCERRTTRRRTGSALTGPCNSREKTIGTNLLNNAGLSDIQFACVIKRDRVWLDEPCAACGRAIGSGQRLTSRDGLDCRLGRKLAKTQVPNERNHAIRVGKKAQPPAQGRLKCRTACGGPSVQQVERARNDIDDAIGANATDNEGALLSGECVPLLRVNVSCGIRSQLNEAARRSIQGLAAITHVRR